VVTLKEQVKRLDGVMTGGPTEGGGHGVIVATLRLDGVTGGGTEGATRGTG
jgi:hypothetical protein